MLNFFKNAAVNWQSTLAGLATLGFAAYKIYSNPASAADPSTIASITAGLGLITAKDHTAIAIPTATKK